MRIKLNTSIAGEAFYYDRDTVLDWPGGDIEAARYCVRGQATPVDENDKPAPMIGELAERLWALSGLRRPRPAVAYPTVETTALDPADENTMHANPPRRGPGRPKRQTVPPDDVELSDD